MKIGIITMHRVLNYGSALQAYALQKYIEKWLGHEVYLIDYIFPNCYHNQILNKKKTLKDKIHGVLGISHDYLLGGRYSRICSFNRFYDNFFNLSNQRYENRKQLKDSFPNADIYVTGSDQVWNINTMANDGTFYLDFVPAGKKKIAFGASFSIKNIPTQYHKQITENLSSYSAIGLREHSGYDFVKTLGLAEEIEIMNTCDPTLLLSAEEYHEVANKSKFKIEGDFVLVYMLKYAFEPRPAITNAARLASEHFGCKVVLIGENHLNYEGNVVYRNNFGPSEFCWLFEHAKYVVTSSFHGTMFSIIYRKPFISIVSSEKDDSRAKDLLVKLGLEKLALPSNKEINDTMFQNPYNNDVEYRINTFLNKSKEFLEENIK